MRNPKLRNLVIRRNIKGFSDGPYAIPEALVHVGDRVIHFAPGTDDLVIEVNSEEIPKVFMHLVALDRKDLKHCFFLVECVPLKLNAENDAVLFVRVYGPCICFHLLSEEQ